MFTESEQPSTGFKTNLTSADLLGRGQEIGCELKWRNHCRTAGGKIMNTAFEKRYNPAPGNAMLRHSHGDVPLLDCFRDVPTLYHRLM